MNSEHKKEAETLIEDLHDSVDQHRDGCPLDAQNVSALHGALDRLSEIIENSKEE